MALKRKRSSISFSSPATIYSTTTTTIDSPSTTAIPYYYQQHKPTPALHEKPTWAFPTYDHSPSAQHLNSRTHKRHRDNRPDEQQVHASTINRLYDAQRKHPDAAPVLSSQSVSAAAVQERPQRSTLHAFWNLPSSAPVRIEGMQLDGGGGHRIRDEAPRCEDCERPLREENAMEVDDGLLEQDTAVERGYVGHDGLHPSGGTHGPAADFDKLEPQDAEGV
ncbi:hypothetical protein B0A55_02427 [Friedmanniomyces simplex]|uniref:Uncharacterized protein n=1 Tax=Friedmanniomyces simplex TaxID=329884 RepID=A0A4V5NJ39_9PEZI|nr:hypothetical protein B0A55_02427 [Friedmanniomyces simplex]